MRVSSIVSSANVLFTEVADGSTKYIYMQEYIGDCSWRITITNRDSKRFAVIEVSFEGIYTAGYAKENGEGFTRLGAVNITQAVHAAFRFVDMRVRRKEKTNDTFGA